MRLIASEEKLREFRAKDKAIKDDIKVLLPVILGCMSPCISYIESSLLYYSENIYFY